MKPTTSTKLNERNVVDIVQKLISQKKVQLIHTSDGKEYITPSQLEEEIEVIVADNSGRMGLSELSSHLGVGIEVVEPTVVQLCALGQGKLINGSFITQLFVDQFLEELSQQVSDLGRISLSDLTNKHWLPIEYVKDVI